MPDPTPTTADSEWVQIDAEVHWREPRTPVAEHSPDCDGSNRECGVLCPVAVQCGPVQYV